MAEDFKSAYRTILDDHFPERMEITFSGDQGRQTLVYEKVTWVCDGVRKGLRYGENPGQEAALYRLANGNLALGDVKSIAPGRYLTSDADLLQSGKHPGKTNLTDVDNALNILRYFHDRPAAVIVKHNNPSGVAIGGTILEAYERAYFADWVAAFGGAVVVNRALDQATAERINSTYCEVVAAPEFEEGAVGILSKRKNLRIMRIGRIRSLHEYSWERFADFKSLVDGGLIVQWSYVPLTRKPSDFKEAAAVHQGKEVRIRRAPTPKEAEDLVFGWLIEAGVSSNSVLYVKDLCTVGIGAGQQDRVGVAEIARDKAVRKLADRICLERHHCPCNLLEDRGALAAVEEEAKAKKGGLIGAAMISDAFFPFRDGVDVGIREGITSVIQPGGSDRDWESIEACNEAGVAMVFTGQRSFKH